MVIQNVYRYMYSLDKGAIMAGKVQSIIVMLKLSVVSFQLLVLSQSGQFTATLTGSDVL